MQQLQHVLCRAGTYDQLDMLSKIKYWLCHCINSKMLSKWNRNMQTCEDMLYKRGQFGADTNSLRATQISRFSCWDNFIIAARAFRPFFFSMSTMCDSRVSFNASQNFGRSVSGPRSRMANSFSTFLSSVFFAC